MIKGVHEYVLNASAGMVGSRSACCCCCCSSDGPSVKPSKEKTMATLGRQPHVRYFNFPTLIPRTVNSDSGRPHLSLYVYVLNGLAMNVAAGDQLLQLGAQARQADSSILSVCSLCKQRMMPERAASLRVKISKRLEELLKETVKCVMKNFSVPRAAQSRTDDASWCLDLCNSLPPDTVAN